jgi:hypothetical protein
MAIVAFAQARGSTMAAADAFSRPGSLILKWKYIRDADSNDEAKLRVVEQR